MVTAMRPYAFPPREASLVSQSSPRPPPLPPKSPPRLSIAAPVLSSIKTLNTKSPVRRKPVPTSASTIPSIVTPTSTNGDTPTSAEHKRGTFGGAQASSGQELGGSELDRSRGTHRTANGLAETVLEPPRADPFTSPPRPLLNERRRPSSTALPPGAATYIADHVQRGSSIEQDTMALKPGTRPPPLRMDSTSSMKSMAANDAKKPQTPGTKMSSFFGWKRTASPSMESLSTENSDSARSPGPSPFRASPHTSAHSSGNAVAFTNGTKAAVGGPGQPPPEFGGPLRRSSRINEDLVGKVSLLEAELREISTELAGSIRREMELEDLVERLQLEAPNTSGLGDRTSDYFSDSGTSSVRPLGSDAGHKDDIDKMKRDLERQRASQRVDLSQKWQGERARRQQLETHVKILEDQILSARRSNSESSDLAAKTRELEASLDDARRRLAEERRTKENFEDLLMGLRVELEQHRNDRDNLRDEVVPQLRTQIEGLETTVSESQRQSYDLARMQQEIKKLREENAALVQKGGLSIRSIAEDELGSPMSPTFNLTRSNSRANLRASLGRSGSVSRPNTIHDSPESLNDKIKAVEQQRDALHTAVKYLLTRRDHQNKIHERRLHMVELERDRAIATGTPHKHGYEKEVRSLRTEINVLRRRADDALEQKWQCEKGLGGLAMDLDRNRQETNGLRQLLHERNGSGAGSAFSSLEKVYEQLQREHESTESPESIAEEQRLADQVKQQLQSNAALRNRLKDAVEMGEQNQAASATQINELQIKLRRLEDAIAAAQNQSETAVMKHEEDVRVLLASHNAQLMRAKAGIKTPGLTPIARSPMSPLFANAKRSPRLDKTTTGPGMALHQALKTEYLEHKVGELERALADAEKEMEEVVGRMNTAQIGVAELQSERDEALRQTRKLEAAIMAGRQR